MSRSIFTALAAALLLLQVSAEFPSFLNSLRDADDSFNSTVSVAARNDTNPYGVAVVPLDWPRHSRIHPGTILVSNFNNASNVQGTGRTIVAVRRHDLLEFQPSEVFFAVPDDIPAAGLTTCLEALQGGIVVVGNAPLDSLASPPTVLDGSLFFISAKGELLREFKHHLLRGPWDCTVDAHMRSRPVLYVSNVLSGTIVRLQLEIERRHHRQRIHIRHVEEVARDFGTMTNSAALVLGPTGLLLRGSELLVADTANNRIQRIDLLRNRQTTFFEGEPLQGPLGMALSPIGTILVSNGDAIDNKKPNMVLEFSCDGDLIATKQLDNGAPGGIFGIAVTYLHGRPALLYAEDNTNTINALESFDDDD